MTRSKIHSRSPHVLKLVTNRSVENYTQQFDGFQQVFTASQADFFEIIRARRFLDVILLADDFHVDRLTPGSRVIDGKRRTIVGLLAQSGAVSGHS